MLPDRREVANQQRRAWSLGASLALHGLALVLLTAWVHEPVPPPRKIEVTLVQAAAGPVPAPGRPRGVEHPPRAASSRPRARTAPPSRPPPVAPNGDLPLPPRRPPEPAAPTGPTSFRDWQRSAASKFLPQGNPFGTGGGGDGASEGSLVVSRDRCEPAPGRRFDTLYLLFDSSGSMDQIRRAQALSCAHQYAKAAIAEGAPVVVGNFARGAAFTGPTLSLEDVEIALRGTVDGSATILPSGELEPFLDRAPDQAAELVIVSDGMFGNSRGLLDWYYGFLQRNPRNRATMYTVGSPGHGESVGQLRGTGMDVFMYEQIRRQ